METLPPPAPQLYFTGQGVEVLPPPDPPAVPSPPTPPAGAYQVDASTKGAPPENTTAVRELVLVPRTRPTRTDDFNRADGALGSNWTQKVGAQGTLVVTGNQAGASVEDDYCMAFWSADSFGDDQYAECTIRNQIDDWTGVIVRADDVYDRCYAGLVDHGILVDLGGIPFFGVQIYLKWDGLWTRLARADDATWVPGDVLGMSITGSAHPITIKLYKNGVEVLSWTSPDATYVRTGGAPGIGMYSHAGKNLRLDNWKGGYLAPPAKLVVSDNFNRADGLLGSNWQAPILNEAALRIVGNKCTVTTEAKYNNAFWAANTFNDNQWAQYRWIDGAAANTNYTGIILRGDAVVNKWFGCLITPDKGKISIYAVFSGTFNLLRAPIDMGTNCIVGDIVRAEIIGTTHPFTINVYRNGILKGSWTSTDSTYVKSGGAPGIAIFSPAGNNLAVDDWKGGNL